MSKKSNTSKATQSTAAAAKAPPARKSTAGRTKLPVSETPAIVETVTAPVVEVPVVEAPAMVSRNEFEAMVRREAYQMAERRGFRNGNPFEDWIRAESAVHARLTTEGVSVTPHAG